MLENNEIHLKYINEFVKTYNLPYSFTDSDSNIAPLILAKDGHLVVKTSWDFMNIAVFYIPSLLTVNEKRWLDNNLESFKKYGYVGFNNCNLINGEVKNELVEDINKEYLEIDKRYVEYCKKKKFEGRVTIVPNEELFDGNIFEEIVVGKENHVDKYQDFSDIYHLGYKFSENDSFVAPLTMASLGHFCYNTAESISNILMYIPEVVTKRQYDYFVNNKEMILKYVGRKATVVKNIDGNFITEELDDFDLIEKEVNKRYEECKKKSEEKGHVR